MTRRRSIAVLNAPPILRHLFRRRYPQDLPQSLLCLLPNDVLLEIADWLSAYPDLIALTSSSSRLYYGLLPKRYHTVVITLNSKRIPISQYILFHPIIAQHVQKIVVSPDWYRKQNFRTAPKAQEEITAARLIRDSANATNLRSLHTLVWRGLHAPLDDMWLALQTSCLHLKHVTTVVHPTITPYHCFLHEFNDLHSFSMRLVSNPDPQTQLMPSRASPRSDSIDPQEASIHPLCRMLCRCTELRELSLEGGGLPDWDGSFENLLLSFLSASSGTSTHWPHLRHFAFEHLGWRSLLSPFLDAHSSQLASMSLLPWENMRSVVRLEDIPSFTLGLSTYSGPYHLIPRVLDPSSVTSLNLETTILPSDSTFYSTTFAPFGKTLTSLAIWCSAPDLKDLQFILAVCPVLNHLELSYCGVPFNFTKFSKIFQESHLSQLASCTLKLREEDLDLTTTMSCRAIAVHILRENLTLQQLRIEYRRHEYYGWQIHRLRGCGPFLLVGIYEADAYGARQCIRAHESKVKKDGRHTVIRCTIPID